MGMLLCAVLLLLPACSFGFQGPIAANISSLIDKQMVAHNAMMTARGVNAVHVPGATTANVTFSEGKQHYITTLKRKGDGLAVRANETVFYAYRVGFGKLAFSFDRIDFEDGGSAEDCLLRIGDNTLLFEALIKRRDADCKVELTKYGFERLDGVEPERCEMSQEQLSKVRSILKEHVNSVLQKKKPDVERVAQAICYPPDIWPTDGRFHKKTAKKLYQIFQ